jgi:hypothetical protein
MLMAPAENRILVIVEDERTVEVPGEIRVIEVQEDGTAR